MANGVTILQAEGDCWCLGNHWVLGVRPCVDWSGVGLISKEDHPGGACIYLLLDRSPNTLGL